MKYRLAEINQYASNCSFGLFQMLNAICTAEEINRQNISKDIINGDQDVILEVAESFVHYANDTIGFDTDTKEVQEFKDIIDIIIECCEENNWFENQ